MIYELPDRIGFSLRFFSLTHGTKGATKMKRLLTAGIFGTILGIVGTGTANASIVSSGFLDEKLTEYALSTSLDLKANQSDLTALSNKIGTLPSGEIGGYGPPVNEMLQDYFYQYPKDLAGIYGVLFGTEENIGVLERFATSTLSGVPNSFSGLYSIGTVPDGKNLVGMISETDAKIGTLPSGNFPDFEGHEFISDIGLPHTYPTSLAELITAIYGGPKNEGVLSAIISGFPDTDGDGQSDPMPGILPNFNLARSAEYLARSAEYLANANATKIGTLPTEYATVGAALTAIKGIAEDAKAAALAAIPDPKQEGSSGKFVLTVDIVGDNATYRWEKIDREGETTTTTE